jgi:hypothetical protein
MHNTFIKETHNFFFGYKINEQIISKVKKYKTVINSKKKKGR